jgi:hypothetical protein
MTVVYPALKKLQEEGELGRRGGRMSGKRAEADKFL